MENTTIQFVDWSEIADIVKPVRFGLAGYDEAYALVKKWADENEAVIYQYERNCFDYNEAVRLAHVANAKIVIKEDCS